jgi:hypothetical protein
MKFDKFRNFTLIKSGLGAPNLSLLFKFNKKGAK